MFQIPIVIELYTINYNLKQGKGANDMFVPSEGKLSTLAPFFPPTDYAYGVVVLVTRNAPRR